MLSYPRVIRAENRIGDDKQGRTGMLAGGSFLPQDRQHRCRWGSYDLVGYQKRRLLAWFRQGCEGQVLQKTLGDDQDSFATHLSSGRVEQHMTYARGG